MKRHLTKQEQERLDRKVAEVERRTGCQVVLAVVERSDSYPELPWKAFALAAAVAGFAAALADRVRASWHAPETTLVVIAATLIAGAAAALLTVLLPDFARLFLDRVRAEAESRQYAESLFLAREVFATRSRSGVLLMVGLFERQVVVLPDKGIAGRITKEELGSVINTMRGPLAAGQVAEALEKGLEELAVALGAGTAGAGNELPNAVIEEKGA